MDMRFGTRNVRGLHRAGNLIAVAKGISKCKLDLAGAQEVRGYMTGKGNESYKLDGFYCTKKEHVNSSEAGDC
jgi:hypothetical protein